jgi:hypothetical protein
MTWRALLTRPGTEGPAAAAAALAALFSANNANHVATAVQSHAGLLQILGRDWLVKQSELVEIHMAAYLAAAWGKAGPQLSVCFLLNFEPSLSLQPLELPNLTPQRGYC